MIATDPARPASAAAVGGVPVAPPHRAALSDAATVALAGLVWVGARLATPLPVTIGVGLVVVAVAVRRPAVLLLAGLALGSTFGARAVEGLQPLAGASFAGTVTMLSDPTDGPGWTTADVRAGRHHVELRAIGAARGEVAGRLAGERLAVEGRIGPPPPKAAWLVPRHIEGVLETSHAEPAGPGSAPWRAANVLRRALARGAASMSADRRALFTGLVLGDDRDESATVTDDFRGSGLTHLLAVSGENVAFVLALVGPVLRRLPLSSRWGLTVAVIAFFMVLTRCEPSVIRAGVMAGLAATAFLLGRPASGIRLLALAVAGLVLVDPLLTRSVGFQLSVAASVGILVVAPPLARSLPGPPFLIEPLAVTAGAQLAVAPLQVALFGGLPVASLPANLLAGPAAGLVMTWGLGAGIPAGVAGGRLAALLHLPTQLGIGWIAAVARVGATVPLGELGPIHVVVVAAALAAVVAARRHGAGRLRRCAVVAVVATLLAPALALRSPPAGAVPVPGGRVWRAGGATVLEVGPEPRVGDLLERLRRLGVRRLDLVVIVGRFRSAPATVTALAHRWPPAAVWAPADGSVERAVQPRPGTVVRIGDLEVAVGRSPPGTLSIVVTVTAPPGPAAKPAG